MFSFPETMTVWLKRWPLITRLRAQLEADLGQAVFWDAWERGTSTDPHSMVRRLLGEMVHALLN